MRTLLLISLFFALAIEPAVNRLAARGWSRGSATSLMLLSVFAAGLEAGERCQRVGREAAAT